MIMINTKMLKYIGVNFSPFTQGRGLSPYFSKLDIKKPQNYNIARYYQYWEV
jgi:hypothetical protein